MSETERYVKISSFLSLLIGATTLGLSVLALMNVCVVTENVIPLLQSQNSTKALNKLEQVDYKTEYMVRNEYFRIFVCRRCYLRCCWMHEVYECDLVTLTKYTNKTVPRLDVSKQSRRARSVNYGKEQELRVWTYPTPCDQSCKDVQQFLSIMSMELAAFQIVGAVGLYFFYEKFARYHFILWIAPNLILLLGFMAVAVIGFIYGSCFTHLGRQEWKWFKMVSLVDSIGLMTLVIILYIVKAFEATLAATGTHVLLPSLFHQKYSGKKAKNNVYAIAH